MRQSPEKVLPILSIPDDYSFTTFSQLKIFRDYLNSETMAALCGWTPIQDSTPLFEVPFNRGEALILLGSMTVITIPQIEPFVSSAVEFPEINAIFFECCGIFGYLRYGDDPKVDMLPMMKFDINNGFTNAHDDPSAKIISAKLQGYFTAWEQNNCQGEIIPLERAVSFAIQSSSLDSFDGCPDEMREILEKLRGQVEKCAKTMRSAEQLIDRLSRGERTIVHGKDFDYDCLSSPKSETVESQFPVSQPNAVSSPSGVLQAGLFKSPLAIPIQNQADALIEMKAGGFSND